MTCVCSACRVLSQPTGSERLVSNAWDPQELPASIASPARCCRKEWRGRRYSLRRRGFAGRFRKLRDCHKPNAHSGINEAWPVNWRTRRRPDRAPDRNKIIILTSATSDHREVLVRIGCFPGQLHRRRFVAAVFELDGIMAPASRRTLI